MGAAANTANSSAANGGYVKLNGALGTYSVPPPSTACRPPHQYTRTSHNGQCPVGAGSPGSTYTASAVTPTSTSATRIQGLCRHDTSRAAQRRTGIGVVTGASAWITS